MSLYSELTDYKYFGNKPRYLKFMMEDEDAWKWSEEGGIQTLNQYIGEVSTGVTLPIVKFASDFNNGNSIIICWCGGCIYEPIGDTLSWDPKDYKKIMEDDIESELSWNEGGPYGGIAGITLTP